MASRGVRARFLSRVLRAFNASLIVLLLIFVVVVGGVREGERSFHSIPFHSGWGRWSVGDRCGGGEFVCNVCVCVFGSL